jgi:hypothetical protein
MSIYARSDLVHVAVSTDHGGCGQSHSRPVIEGAPVKLWQLTCHGGCEDHLRSDPLWSTTISDIPETHDEYLVREDQEKRGARDQADATVLALSELAKLGDLPAAISQLAALMAGQFQAQLPPVETLDRLCQNGHRNRADSAFCVQCGADLTAGVPNDRGPQLPPPPSHELDDLTIGELRGLAKERGVSGGRSKADLIAALQAADGE